MPGYIRIVIDMFQPRSVKIDKRIDMPKSARTQPSIESTRPTRISGYSSILNILIFWVNYLRIPRIIPDYLRIPRISENARNVPEYWIIWDIEPERI